MIRVLQSRTAITQPLNLQQKLEEHTQHQAQRMLFEQAAYMIENGLCELRQENNIAGHYGFDKLIHVRTFVVPPEEALGDIPVSNLEERLGHSEVFRRMGEYFKERTRITLLFEEILQDLFTALPKDNDTIKYAIRRQRLNEALNMLDLIADLMFNDTPQGSTMVEDVDKRVK